MGRILQNAGADGCFYQSPDLYTDPGKPAPRDEAHTNAEREGRILALCMRYRCDREPAWKRLIERKIDRLTKPTVALSCLRIPFDQLSSC